MYADEYAFKLNIEHLPEGLWLAMSEDFPGLVAQGRTVEELIEIARDVARKLLESWEEHGDPIPSTLVPIVGPRSLDVAVSV
ncbi:MAG: type II toxin-antitoxin system HicB family antitoxin [Spirochaetota bacterium]